MNSIWGDSRYLTEATWEIYEIGMPRPYAWSWRCRIADRVVRQSDLMYPTIREAIDDAVAHGMENPTAQTCPAGQ